VHEIFDKLTNIIVPGEQMDDRVLCKLEHLSLVCFQVALQLLDPLVIQHSTCVTYNAVNSTMINRYIDYDHKNNDIE